MTHDELVERAARWLKGQGYKVALTEFRTASSEEPDAFGLNGASTCLVECKTSRADFLADKKKWFRRNPSMGLGVYRYFLTPKGLVRPDELPEGWGLLEIRGQRTFKIEEAAPFDRAAAMKAERPVIYSLLRRLSIVDPDLLIMAVDITKLELKLAAKAERLHYLERDLERKETHLIAKEKDIAERVKQTDFGPILARKVN